MLRRLSEEIAECHRHAREARERAEHAPDEDKVEHLAAEGRWLLLAQNYELVGRISDFRRRSEKRAVTKSPPEPGLLRTPPCPGCATPMQRVRIEPPGTSARFARTHLRCETCDVTTLHPDRTADD